MKNYVITIARGFGSSGKQIGIRLAEELGIHCYENRILTLASQLAGEQEADFAKSDEQLRRGYWGALLHKLPQMFNPYAQTDRFTSDDYVYQYEAKIIRDLAESESCIIIGKAADHVLKDYPNVLSIYIEAPRPYCRARIMEEMHVTADEADELITKTDHYRAEYYRYHTGGNYWTNPVNYDLTLNSNRLGVDNCVAIIEDALSHKLGVPVPEKHAASIHMERPRIKR